MGVTPNSVHLDTKVLHPSWKDCLIEFVSSFSFSISEYNANDLLPSSING